MIVKMIQNLGNRIDKIQERFEAEKMNTAVIYFSDP